MKKNKNFLDKILVSLSRIIQRKEFWVQFTIVSIMVFCDVYYLRIPMILIYAVFLIFIGTAVSLVNALIRKNRTDYQYKLAVVVLYILFFCLDVKLIDLMSEHFRGYKGIHEIPVFD